jgi:amino acid transporter
MRFVMEDSNGVSNFDRLKSLFAGKAKNFKDGSVFHKISLIAFFAWIGLGADGLSSSCYGPSEAFLNLGNYHFLGIFVDLGTVLTIAVISRSYSQTIEVFPSGGGGYIVASKLHSPFVGMISGSALLIDYILTISVSVSSGSEAIFSFLPIEFYDYRIILAIFIVIFLIYLNLRGVKESVLILAPIFILFVLTHVFAIVYSLSIHLSDMSTVVYQAQGNMTSAVSNLGFFGPVFLVMKAFSMGAGTFTGIEAVSNGIPVLREPKVATAKKTMIYMAVSLAFMALGLMLSYLLYNVQYEQGKTLNAVLFGVMVSDWGMIGSIFILVTLISEAAILFVAAQAGFLDGPRILSNMAIDKWMPSRFSLISDKLVAKNGTLVIGIVSIFVILLSGGKVEFLIILYSINVFITFSLTESAMVKYWYRNRFERKDWKKKISFHIVSLLLDIFILTFIIIIKFSDGGWVTLFVTCFIVVLALLIRKHYDRISELVKKIDKKSIEDYDLAPIGNQISKDQNSLKTVVLLVNGYNGLSIHTLNSILKLFGNRINKIILVQVGVINTSNFKREGDYEKIEAMLSESSEKFQKLLKKTGIDCECITSVGVDVLHEIELLIKQIKNEYDDILVFSGQLIIKKATFLNKILDNNIVFSLQRKMFDLQIPYMVIPVRF